MNQVLDKLGIYDLVVVLLSGICITTFSLFADQVIFQSQLSNFLKVEDTILFLVISYFVGVIFQELSSFLQKRVIYKNNKLLLKALDTSPKSHQFLTQEEKESIFKAVQKELALEMIPNEDMVYNYCRFLLIATGDTTRADKDQSTSGMSRSLSLYLFLLFIFMTFSAIQNQNTKHFLCAVVILALSVLLYYRYIRFAKMRYVYILRSFYYNFLHDKLKNTRECSITKEEMSTPVHTPSNYFPISEVNPVNTSGGVKNFSQKS